MRFLCWNSVDFVFIQILGCCLFFFFYFWCNWNLKWKETKKKCQNGKYCECQMLRIFDEMIEKLFRPHTRTLGWQHIHDIRNCWLPKSQSLMASNSNGINYLFTLRLYKSVDILLLLSTLISVFIRFAMLTSDDDEYIVSIDFVCRTCNVSYLFDSFTVCVFFFCLGNYTGWRETSRKWIVRSEFISIK